jgi:hypothetical protein
MRFESFNIAIRNRLDIGAETYIIAKKHPCRKKLQFTSIADLR